MADSKVKMTESEDKLTTYHEVDFQPIDHHEWRQFGNSLMCSSCPNNHSTFIKPGLVLGKDDDGKFVLRSVKEDQIVRTL